MSTITVKDGTTIYYKDWGKGPSNTAPLTVHSPGERLRPLAAKLVRLLARQSPPSSAAAESQHSGYE